MRVYVKRDNYVVYIGYCDEPYFICGDEVVYRMYEYTPLLIEWNKPIPLTVPTDMIYKEYRFPIYYHNYNNDFCFAILIENEDDLEFLPNFKFLNDDWDNDA